MYNFVDEEEFEIRNGIYYSKNKIMGKDFIIMLDNPIGKYFAKILEERGVEGLKKYIGTDRAIKVLSDGIYTTSDKPSCEIGIKFITGCYVFKENSTFVHTGCCSRIKYAENRENFSLRVNEMYYNDFPRWLRVGMRSGNTENYFREIFEWAGKLNIELKKRWGSYVVGNLRYRGKNREIDSEIKIDGYDGRVLLRTVPFVEGVYALSFTGKINLDTLSVKNLSKAVNKRLVYGIGANYKFEANARAIYYDDGYPVVDFEKFKLYYDEDQVGVKTKLGMKWINYEDWAIMESGLVSNDAIVVLW